jgi:hypothetical protein
VATAAEQVPPERWADVRLIRLDDDPLFGRWNQERLADVVANLLGNAFYLELPLAPPDQIDLPGRELLPEQPAEVSTGEHLTAPVVEDDAWTRFVLSELLEGAGRGGAGLRWPFRVASGESGAPSGSAAGPQSARGLGRRAPA